MVGHVLGDAIETAAVPDRARIASSTSSTTKETSVMRFESVLLSLALATALGCGSSSGTGSASVTPPADSGSMTEGTTVTLTMGPFNVPAGTEVYKCQTFANPFGGHDVDIKTYEEHMTTGSHHMFLFFSPNATDGQVGDCPSGGLEFHPYPFTSQEPDLTLTYPDTVGSAVPGTMGFMLNAHFVNAGAKDFMATLTVTLHVAAPGTVTNHAGVTFMNNLGINISPSNMPQTASATCTLPQDMTVLASGSHMHQRATAFVATDPTQMLYQTNSWNNPVPAVYDPPLYLTKGTAVTFSCTYVNDTGQPLTFGESAQTNVMCIYEMSFYPALDPTNPTIACMTE
jgi:hypothetical protein